MTSAVDLLIAARVMPVLTIERVEDAVPLARALFDGGLMYLEVTLRTQCALEAISLIAQHCPGIIVGAGTILDAQDLARAGQAGAAFALSPGATPDLLEVGRASAIPFIPGVATASELMHARALGYRGVKFFPAEQLGGASALKSLTAPIPDMSICPTGGIGPANIDAYRAIPSVLCIGGSWMATPALIAAKDWAQITKLARACR